MDITLIVWVSILSFLSEILTGPQGTTDDHGEEGLTLLCCLELRCVRSSLEALPWAIGRAESKDVSSRMDQFDAQCAVRCVQDPLARHKFTGREAAWTVVEHVRSKFPKSRQLAENATATSRCRPAQLLSLRLDMAHAKWVQHEDERSNPQK